MILPHDNKILKAKAMMREGYKDHTDKPKLLRSVELQIAFTLKKEIELSQTKTRYVTDILQNKDITTLELFHFLDDLSLGFTTLHDVDRFLKKCSILLSQEELQAFLRRADRDKDERISYTDFNEFLLSLPSTKRGRPQSPELSNSTRFRTPDKPNVSSHVRTSSAFTRSMVSMANHRQSPTRYSPAKTTERLNDQDYLDFIAKQKQLNSSMIKSYSGRETPHMRQERPRNQNELIGDLSRRTNGFSGSVSQFESRDRYESPNRRTFDNRFKTPERPGAGKVRRNIQAEQRASPFKMNEKEELALALKEQIDLCRKIEHAKEDLAISPDFTLMGAFHIFDPKLKGKISREQLEKGCQTLGVCLLENEIELLMKRWDKDVDGYLSYAEFISAFLPVNEDYSRSLRNKRQESSSHLTGKERQAFSPQTMSTFAKCLQLYCTAEIVSKSIRERLSRRMNFSLYEAFHALDSTNRGYIGNEEFKEILNEYGIFATRNEIRSLVNRYDHDRDGKISFGEFVREMSPSRIKSSV